MKKTFTCIAVLCALQTFALDPNHFTITRISAPYFIVDGNSPATINQAYVGFEVKNNSNSTTTYSGLKFSIISIGTSVAGQNYSITAPASGMINVGTLLPGQSKVCYYYISYPAYTTAQATFNLLLGDNTAGSKSQAINIRNRSSISANAGGTATQSFTNQDIIGGLIYDDVTYVVGNVQNGDESYLQVAVSSQFDPAKLTLVGTQVTASTVPGIPAGTTDSLYFVTGNGTNGATVTVRWTFRITDFNFTNYLLPCAGATSGATNYKYTLNTALGSGSPVTISAFANPLLITKLSDKTVYTPGAIAYFTITIQNPGAYGITIDRITDQVPAGFVYQSLDAVSQVTALNSTSVPAAGATGSISFEGGVVSGSNTSYYIPSGSWIELKYTAIAPGSNAFNLLTTVKDFIGSTQVGLATNSVSVSNSPIPVVLSGFTGGWVNEAAKLNWTTFSEMNSSVFIIERAGADGIYQKIGQLAAAGNSTTARYYTFTDASPLEGLNQYRLQMTDIDRHYNYSNIVALNKKTLQRIVAFPIPFLDNVNVKLIAARKQNAIFRITDLKGRTLLEKRKELQKGISLINLDELDILEPGIYNLDIRGEESWHCRLVKIR